MIWFPSPSMVWLKTNICAWAEWRPQPSLLSHSWTCTGKLRSQTQPARRCRGCSPTRLADPFPGSLGWRSGPRSWPWARKLGFGSNGTKPGFPTVAMDFHVIPVFEIFLKTRDDFTSIFSFSCRVAQILKEKMASLTLPVVYCASIQSSAQAGQRHCTATSPELSLHYSSLLRIEKKF